MKTTSSISRIIKFYLPSFIVFGVFSAYSQEMPKMNMDTSAVNHQSMSDGGNKMSDEDELPHPFFTHMGMPEGVGVYSLRLAALATQMDSKTNGDFAFHFETSLSKFVGLHIRNDRFLYNPRTEVMFQFAVIKSKDGMSGFSPIIEFEIPTKKGESRINTLIGFSTAFVKSRFAFNQVIHYNPREDMIDGSAALVYKAGKRVFLIAEIIGNRMSDGEVIINLLAGVKVKINENIALGIGYQQPITNNMDFSSQYIFSPDMEWKRLDNMK